MNLVHRIAALVVLVVLGSCDSTEGSALDPLCTRHPEPEDDFGVADLLIGYYFDADAKVCDPASGDLCDEACQAEKVPFDSLEDCIETCVEPRR